MKTSEQRRAYIRDHFRLDAHQGGWMARQFDSNGQVISSRFNNDLGKLLFDVRRQWGHFNFEDESEEFSKIFPRQ